MKTLFTKVYYVAAVIILFLGATLRANAQLTTKTLSTDGWASIATRDASGNVYVVEAVTEAGFSDNGKVLKYTGGTGTPTVIYSGSGLPFTNCDGQTGNGPLGLAVTSNGDVYVTTVSDYFASNCSPFYGNIIKLTYNSGTNTYAESTFLAGNANFGVFTSLAVDASDNLYALVYDATGNGGAPTAVGINGSYEIEEFPASGGVPQAGSKSRIAAGDALKLYVNALNSNDNYSNINGLAIDPSGNIYVADAFDNSAPSPGVDGAHVYKLTKSGSTYTASTFTTGQYTAGLASDLSGNIYATIAPVYGTNYKLVEYAGGSPISPQTLYTSLTDGGPENFYPIGIVPINSTEIFVCNGTTGGSDDGDFLELFGTPATQATNVTFSSIAATTATASWTNGSGTSRAVFIKQASTLSPAPVNSTSYTANANYGSGTQIGGTGWYCIYNGTGTTVNITGLTAGQTYRVMAVEYNGATGSSDENYFQTTGTNNPNNVTPILGETITFNALPTKTYGNGDFAPGATSTNGSVTITYVSDNTAVATIVSGNIHIVGQGTAHITASQAGDGTHSAAADQIQLLTVNKAALTITAVNQSKAYGAALPTLTASYSGFITGESSANLATLPTLGTSATAASHVAGSPYSITASGAVAANYAISYVAGSLTITTVPLTVTANNQTKAYGAAVPTLTASYSGLVNGDTGGSLTTQPTLGTTATAASHVAGNPYSITASGAVDADYTISYVAGSLTVGTAALTITADNQTKAYGAAVPTLTASYSGLVNGDTGGSLTTQPTLGTTATAASHVAGNPYSITASGAVDADYTISYVAGSLTVGTAALTITADNQTKAYGAAVPTLTASYSGLVNGDTGGNLTTQPTLGTTATAASHVAGNPYSITASGAVDADYTISYVAGSLTVGTAALTITADNQTKAYGAAVPTLTASYSGLVNGDTGGSLTTQPTLGTTATAASHVAGNPYSITASGAVDADYTISYVAGSLTVGTAALTITADNQTKAYGAAVPTLTASYGGLVNGDTGGSLTTQPTLGTTATAASHVAGNPYSITASGAVDADYTISYVAGTLTVTQAPLTITADNQSMVFGQAVPTLTATYATFVNGDNSGSLTTLPTLGTSGTSSSLPGSYGITPSGAVDGDYAISYVNGTLTITGTTDATLANLGISAGTLSPSFAPGTTSYSASVSHSVSSITLTPTTNDVNATVTVNSVTVPSGTASSAISLNAGPNTITTVVTAQDGSTLDTYTVVVTRASSTNANLGFKLSKGTLSPTFSTGVTSYTASVSNGVSSITVIPTTVDPNATVTVDGTTVSSGTSSAAIPLSVGPNTITITGTAQDGTTQKTYTVILTRIPLTNDNLASLKLDKITLSPSFTTGNASYTASVSYFLMSTTVTPTVSDPTATVTVNGTTVTSGTASGTIALNVGDNIINTVVTAQDGTTQKNYTVTVTRAPSSNANLGIKISNGTLSPTPFETNTTSYTVAVTNAVASVTVMATTVDPNATLTINGTAVTSGTSSSAIPLAVGPNTITVIGTAQDGTTTKTYTLTVTRAPGSDAYLALFHPSKGTLSTPFSPLVYTYTSSVTNSVTSMTVTPTTFDPTATVTVNNVAVTSGSASLALPLSIGDNTITTVVTAQDGTTTLTYTLTVTRATGPIPAPNPQTLTEMPVENSPSNDGVVVHQAVSANGDGMNDFLTIEGIAKYPENKLMIMNRSGVLIYETKGYDNSSRKFDGHSNKTGTLQQPGTYFYSLEYKSGGVTKHKTGFIILKY